MKKRELYCQFPLAGYVPSSRGIDVGELPSKDTQPKGTEEPKGFPDASEEAAEQSCEDKASSDTQSYGLQSKALRGPRSARTWFSWRWLVCD